MKRNLDIIKTKQTDMLVTMQDEDARKLLAGRERLLALNAIFDAVLTGESGKRLAKELYHSSHGDAGLTRTLIDDEKTTEH